uniref:Ig-like domain-containing protein n=1 Tax=Buteo japonicus TaxID=224669 RepID=A0A8C0HJR9_9AVES
FFKKKHLHQKTPKLIVHCGLVWHAGNPLEVVKSKVGEKVGLPCCHEIPSSESLHSYRVYWQKNTTEVVLAYADGKMISKHEQYVNRTEMDARNLTLWISPVEILDNGSYQCIVQHRRLLQNSVVVCLAIVCLSEADFSKPNVTADVLADSCESTEMVVRCSSYGGFPKPKLSGALDNESTAWNDSWVSESSLRRPTGSCCDLVMSASVAPTGWGCHLSVPLYTSMIWLPVAWYRPGIRMEGLEKCVCLKSHRLHLKRISSFNKHVCSCFSDRNCQLGARQNSAFIYIFNIGLTHTEKKSITVHGLKVIT